MQPLCFEKNQLIDVTIAGQEPSIFYLEPFVGEMDFCLKIPLSNSLKGFCCFVPPKGNGYAVPHYFTHLREIPYETYLIFFENESFFTALLTLSHKDLLSSFFCISQELRLKVVSGYSREANKKRAALIALKDSNPYELFRKCMQLAIKETGINGKMQTEKPPLPSSFHKIGWHSRLAFGREVTHDKIIQAVKSLKKFDLTPGFVLIEEGWQQLDRSAISETLYDFEADRTKFPSGLKGLVQSLKDEGVTQIGVWHAVMGYRDGVHAKLAKYYDLPPDECGRYFLGYDLGKSFQFFNDYYSFLKEQGITFVKVGDQENIPNFCRQGMDRTRLNKNLQMAIQAAASLHFQTSQFNAGCLRNENLFYWTTSQVAAPAEYLEMRKGEELACYIRNILINSLWLQHSMHLDLDTLVSSHCFSETLAIFHALSGSFVALSDLPQKHDCDLIKKMTLPSGIILKTDRPLTLCQDCLFDDPLEGKKIYKAHTIKSKWGIIAAFNFMEEAKNQTTTLSPNEIPDIKAESYAAYSYRHGFLGVINKTDSISLKFEPFQSDIVTFAPIEFGIAVIGSDLFFLAPGSITEINIEEEALHISTMINAPLLIYCERKILEIRRNGIVVPWTQNQKNHIVSFDGKAAMEEMLAYYTITFEA